MEVYTKVNRLINSKENFIYLFGELNTSTLFFLKTQENCASLHQREEKSPHTKPISHTGTKYESGVSTSHKQLAEMLCAKEQTKNETYGNNKSPLEHTGQKWPLTSSNTSGIGFGASIYFVFEVVLIKVRFIEPVWHG